MEEEKRGEILEFVYEKLENKLEIDDIHKELETKFSKIFGEEEEEKQKEIVCYVMRERKVNCFNKKKRMNI